MKKALFFAVILFSLFTALVQARVWTDSKGRKVTADYVGMSETDSSKVKLKTANGSVYSFPVSSLSEEDQEYIKSLNKGASNPLNGFGSDDDESVSEDASNPNNVVVIVEGAGETLAEAKKDALRCAVEEVVGSLVDAQSRVENDELIEQILTASSAYVEKYTVLSRKIENGLATVKIRATVVKTSLTKKLKLSEGGQTVAIDGASLAGKAATKSESEKNGALFLANFLRKEEFPYSLIDVKIVGQPKVVQTGNEIEYTLTWEISVNRERYMDFIKRLQPILDKCALRKSNFILELEKETDDDGNIYFEWESDQIKELADEPNIQFYLCTGIAGNFRSLKYMSYELPQKYKIPIQYYGRVAPAVNIALLNSKSEEIAIKRIVICGDTEFADNYLLPINLCPSLRGKLEFNKAKETGESIIGKVSDYANVKEGLNWLSISPFQGFEEESSFYPSYRFTTTLTISSEELEQVKSATISVISNNPDMDKAFERMPKEIDKVPTE